MRKLLQLLFVCILFLLVTLSLLVYFSIEQQPRVKRSVTVGPEQIGRLKKIIDTHRYRVYPGMFATANVLQKDADVAANYLVNHFTKGRAQVKLADRQALVQISIPLPKRITEGYLNLDTTVVQTKGFPEFKSVRIGQVALPDFVTEVITTQLIQWLKMMPEFGAALDAIKHVQVSPTQLSVLYHLDNSSKEDIGVSILDEAAQARVQRYHTLLVRNSQTWKNRTVTFSQVISPLLSLAKQQGGNAVAENRALILAATFYVVGFPIQKYILEAADWPRPVRKHITLDGRNDLAKHFIVSAAITAYADTVLSDAIGLYKEIEDARSGSGFSFNDIAADRAGTRFGEEATADQNTAKRIQILGASGLKDTDMMPAWKDLPEFMSEAEFNKRFGGIHTRTYREMMDKIEARIARLRILSKKTN